MTKKGFTLVELVAVIIILGIILLIAIPGINIQLKNARKDAFEVTCKKIYESDEKYELYQDLVGSDNECVIFDFDKKVEETTIIDGNIYEPLSKIGFEKEEGIKGQFKICGTKELNITNGEHSCSYNDNNKKVVSSKEILSFPSISVEIEPEIEDIKVTVHSDTAYKYFYKIDNEKYVSSKENKHTFEGLKGETKYKIKVYVENKQGIKSETLSYEVTTKESFHGIPQGDYKPGDIVLYDGIEFIVVKDNGDNTTLITKYNQKADKYGDTTSWRNSSAKEYLNNEWVNSRNILKTDIEKNGIIYDDESETYIRLIRRNELTTKIPNASKTLFWTMTSVGNELYYGLANGEKQYTEYQTTADREVTYYSGQSEELIDITKQFTKNEITETQKDAKATPTSLEITMPNSLKNISSTVTGEDSYYNDQTTTYEKCNCVDSDCKKCTTTKTFSTTYCTSSTCKQWNKWWSTSSSSCGQISCGKGTSTKCNTYTVNGVSYPTDCGPVEYVKYCDSYCTGSKEVSECSSDIYVCAGTETKYSTTKKTSKTSKYTCCASQTCETCPKIKNMYKATGNDVTYNRYIVSDTSGTFGIRAVITVRENALVLKAD